MTSARRLREFWESRQPREQRVLRVGAGSLLLLLIWLLLIEPAIEGRSYWQQALPRWRGQLAQMRAIASEIAALPARPASAPSAEPPPPEAVRRQAPATARARRRAAGAS